MNECSNKEFQNAPDSSRRKKKTVFTQQRNIEKDMQKLETLLNESLQLNIRRLNAAALKTSRSTANPISSPEEYSTENELSQHNTWSVEPLSNHSSSCNNNVSQLKMPDNNSATTRARKLKKPSKKKSKEAKVKIEEPPAPPVQQAPPTICLCPPYPCWSQTQGIPLQIGPPVQNCGGQTTVMQTNSLQTVNQGQAPVFFMTTATENTETVEIKKEIPTDQIPATQRIAPETEALNMQTGLQIDKQGTGATSARPFRGGISRQMPNDILNSPVSVAQMASNFPLNMLKNIGCFVTPTLEQVGPDQLRLRIDLKVNQLGQPPCLKPQHANEGHMRGELEPNVTPRSVMVDMMPQTPRPQSPNMPDIMEDATPLRPVTKLDMRDPGLPVFTHFSDNAFIWCIYDYKQLQQEDHRLWSEPFYLGEPGYRLKAKVEIDSTNLGIYIKLVPGAYDNQLEWPFDREICFTILDQTKQGSNMQRVLKPYHGDPEEQGLWDMPDTESAKANPGWGFPNLAPTAFIDGNKSFSSPYLRNDRLYIKIGLV